MKIVTTSHLIAADRFMDRCGLSFINNFVNCMLKIYLKYIGEQAREASPNHRYWTYIDEKDKLTCGLGLLPIVGSVCIWANNMRIEKLAQSYISCVKDGKDPSSLNISEDDQDLLCQNPSFVTFIIKQDPENIKYVSFDLLYNSSFMGKLVDKYPNVVKTETYQELLDYDNMESDSYQKFRDFNPSLYTTDNDMELELDSEILVSDKTTSKTTV